MGRDWRQRNRLGAIRGLPARDDGAEGEWGRCVERIDGMGTCGGRREREKGDGETRERYVRDRQERDENVQRTGESAGDKESREKARQTERGRERDPSRQRKRAKPARECGARAAGLLAPLVEPSGTVPGLGC